MALRVLQRGAHRCHRDALHHRHRRPVHGDRQPRRVRHHRRRGGVDRRVAAVPRPRFRPGGLCPAGGHADRWVAGPVLQRGGPPGVDVQPAERGGPLPIPGGGGVEVRRTVGRVDVHLREPEPAVPARQRRGLLRRPMVRVRLPAGRPRQLHVRDDVCGGRRAGVGGEDGVGRPVDRRLDDELGDEHRHMDGERLRVAGGVVPHRRRVLLRHVRPRVPPPVHPAGVHLHRPGWHQHHRLHEDHHPLHVPVTHRLLRQPGPRGVALRAHPVHRPGVRVRHRPRADDDGVRRVPRQVGPPPAGR